jgi:hypothetical protein
MQAVGGRRIILVLGAVLVLVVGVGALSAWMFLPHPIDETALDRMTPQQLTRTYLVALSSGDRSTAAACVAPDRRSYVGSGGLLGLGTPDGRDHYAGMRDLKISEPGPMGEYSGYPETVEMAADWRVGDGGNTRFVIVGRRPPNTGWRVISIGTGP